MNDERRPEKPFVDPPSPSPSAEPVIVLTGFMGTGKTAVGRALADLMGLELLDSDAEIERTAGMPVSRIFETFGETHFRRLEASLCEGLKERRGIVIATGGGTLMNEANHDLLSRMGDIVLLEAPPGVLARRLGDTGTRPLLAPTSAGGASLPDRIRAILDERAAVYGRIPIRFDTSSEPPEKTAARIAARLTPRSTHSIMVSLLAEDIRGGGPIDYARTLKGRFGTSEVRIGRGALSTLGRELRAADLAGVAFILAPAAVLTHFRTQIETALDAASLTYRIIPIDDGDSHKTMDQVSRVIDRLVEFGATRDSTIIPVGGGVTGDIGGFVASVYMRGVPLVHVPTTLLAQVDSSIGAKVGVNHAVAKNLIGAFYQPHFVLSDPCTLRMLPLAELSNGMAEVVKTALVGSAEFFEVLEKETSSPRGERFRDSRFLERCVHACARIKAAIVNRDPFEKDVRRMLNLGHTVGHAVEASAGYQGLTHGQAVSLGLVAALEIAVSRGLIEPALRDRTVRVLEWCGLPVGFGGFDRGAFSRAMGLDKKIRERKLHVVLPTGLGRVTVVDDVTVEEILSTIEKG